MFEEHWLNVLQQEVNLIWCLRNGLVSTATINKDMELLCELGVSSLSSDSIDAISYFGFLLTKSYIDGHISMFDESKSTRA